MAGIIDFILLIVALVFSISVHEFSHAWTAFKLGDPTAVGQGRLTLNPMKHIDPLGMLMVIFASIGWGRPVEVNPNNFKNKIRDNALVSFAGPLSNLIFAIILTIPYRIIPDSNAFYFLHSLFGLGISINVLLFYFNLLPVKPLDGMAILAYLMPRNYYLKYENLLDKHSAYIIAFVVIDIFFLQSYTGFSVLEFIIYRPTAFTVDLIMLGA